MKIEIFDDCPKVEDTLRLKLIPNILNNGGVKILAVDENGKAICNVVGITSNGELYRYNGLKPNIRSLLKVDSNGRIASCN